ncbi:cell wall protein DAN4-like [Tachysurus fulvidraco]|uniref:cell wall protein DAN4-like n=1 Tax=Tachysurus fulvidraco TaxID=1234273 RepID=UPI001FEEE31B|nr:cell wall protein DAN4-like [Tachysurus fulvidraco]
MGNGSIVTNSSLEFSDNGTIPTKSTIESILVNSTTNSSLKIVPDSISVSQVLANTTTANTTSPTTTTANTTSSTTASANTTTANTTSPTTTTATTTSSTITSANTTSSTTTSANTTTANTTTPTTPTANTTSSTTTSANTTSPTTTSANTTSTTSATTTISTTIIPTTPQNATAIFNLTFSINETFDPALANTSSSQFAKKSTYIRNQVEPLYKKEFKNFILMQIIKFRNGSTITESNLYMDSSAPNVTLTQVKDIFLSGLTNFNFSVIPDSITVNQIGNSVPPVIASSVSMMWMSLLTLLFSLALHV